MWSICSYCSSSVVGIISRYAGRSGGGAASSSVRTRSSSNSGSRAAAHFLNPQPKIVKSFQRFPLNPKPQKDAVAVMKPGSVVVDLAAVGGGNCELTKLLGI